MSIVSIHFQPPADNPTKLPRPVHLLDNNGGGFNQRPDNIGLLVGLSRDPSAPDNFDDPEQWIESGELFDGLTENADEVPVDVHHRGWFPAFMDEDAGIYTALNPVDRIEVTA